MSEKHAELLALGHDYIPGECRCAGWWMSEKYDGWRGYWTGRELFTRHGTPIAAPAWWLAELPHFPLDGELWAGYGQLGAVKSACQRSVPDDAEWRKIRYLIWHSPDCQLPFEAAHDWLTKHIHNNRVVFIVQYRITSGEEQIREQFKKVTARGGEGLVLVNPTVTWEPGRRIKGIFKVTEKSW